MSGGHVLYRPVVRHVSNVLARVRAPRWIVWSAAAFVVAIVCWAVPGEALATDYVVTLVADQADLLPGNGLCDASPTPGDQCTLRAAIQELNAQGGGPHTITLPPAPYTLTLTGTNENAAASGDLDITANITIAGFFAPATFIQACDAISDPNCIGIDRVFDVHSGGSLTINGVTIRKGSASQGGGVRVNDGGAVTLSNTVLEENRTAASGGGISVGDATATLTNVTLRNNDGGGGGGGIMNEHGQVTLTNVTISGNKAGFGAGLEQFNGATASTTLTNVTIANNTSLQPRSGGGLIAGSGTITLRNSIVSGNVGPANEVDNCLGAGSGTFVSQGFNLVFPGIGCGLSAATNDLLDADPKLGPLQANGIQVPTHALFPGSAAIDAGNPATPGSGGEACTATDPRGIARTSDGDLLPPSNRCDIGAFEVPFFAVNDTADVDDAVPGNGTCATSTDGPCTLRAAIRESNALGAGAIRISGDPFTLTLPGSDEDAAATGDLDITGGITIARSGVAPAFIQACDLDANPNCLGIDRVFHVRPGAALTMRSVTVRGGNVSSNGGGINSAGSLVLTNVVLDRNRSNEDDGGGLRVTSTGTATLHTVSVTNNVTDDNGGGIFNAGTLVLTNVTISGNLARDQDGGGLYQQSTTANATLTNVTIADNGAGDDGGGVHLQDGTITLRNSLVANNTASAPGLAQCSGGGAYVSQGFNLVFPGTGCGLSGASNDLVNADPNLGPLGFNGAQTLTRPLLVGSAAIDAGNPAEPLDGQDGRCPERDQNTEPRRDGDNDGIVRCDIGASELITLLPIDLAVTLADGVSTVNPGAVVSYTLTVTNPGTETVPNVEVLGVFPSPLSSVSWSCSGTAGSNCLLFSGNGDIVAAATIGPLGSVTYTVQAIVPPDASGGSIVATASILLPGGIADPNPANNTATDTNTIPTVSPPPSPTPTPPVAPTACAPRPAVAQPVTLAGPGRVRLTLTPSTNAGQTPNRIQAVRLGTLQNAVVDVPAQPGVPAQNGLGSGASIALSGPVSSLQLFVRRVSGAPAPFTAPMTVTDGCGAWPTFAGAGAGVP